MIRPGGMSSDEESDYDDYHFSNTVTAKKKPTVCEKISLEEEFLRAVTQNEIDKVAELLDKGANVNYKPNDNWNAIIQSSSLGCYELVKLLIDRGADINSSHEKFTPLLAVSSSTCRNEEELLDCLDLLISKGAKVNSTDWFKVSALSHAVRQNHEKLVIKLINEGADVDSVDQDGWSPIFFAVESGNINLVSLLKDSGTNIYVLDRRGRTLIDIASEKDHVEIIQLLNGGLEPHKWLIPFEDSEKRMSVYDRVVSQFPNKHDRLSGFRHDALNMLNAVQLSHLNRQFYESNIGFGHLLTIDDAKLKEIGVHFWFERRKILRTVEKFHEHPWSISSFGSAVSHPDPDFFHIAQMMATVTRQIYLLSVSSYWWAKNGGIDPEIKTLKDTLRENLKTVKSLERKLKSMQMLVKKRNEDYCSIPSDLILPEKKGTRSAMKTIIASAFVGYLIYKCDVSSKISSIFHYSPQCLAYH